MGLQHLKQRIAIGRRLGGDLGPNVGARARANIHDDSLTEGLAHALGHQPPDDLSTAGAWDDKAHRLFRISLRPAVGCRKPHQRVDEATPNYRHSAFLLAIARRVSGCGAVSGIRLRYALPCFKSCSQLRGSSTRRLTGGPWI